MTSALETASRLFHTGGWVMWPLALLSIVSVTLAVERALFWSAVHRPGRGRWLARLGDALRESDRARARDVCVADRSPYAALARTLIEKEGSEAAAFEQIELVRPAIERSLNALAAIVTVAPLLGILGTVTGIIQSFQLLGEQAGSAVGDPSLVAAGVAEALITTAAGLVIAIVTFFPLVFFRSSATRALGRMEALAGAALHGAQNARGASSGEEGRGDRASRPAPRAPVEKTITETRAEK